MAVPPAAEYQVRQLRDRLDDHVIVCGFGATGRAVVAELLAHHHPREQIVVVDPDADRIAQAEADRLTAVEGNASPEAVLRTAAVDKAAYVLAAPNRDDACVLIRLTVRNLSSRAQIVAAAREEENVKFLYQAGADLVVAPSVSGGRLMATAVRQSAVPRMLEDLLSFGGGLDVREREVRPEEAGMRADRLPDLADTLVLGVVRGSERSPFGHVAEYPLAPGDLVVYLVGDPAWNPASHRSAAAPVARDGRGRVD